MIQPDHDGRWALKQLIVVVQSLRYLDLLPSLFSKSNSPVSPTGCIAAIPLRRRQGSHVGARLGARRSDQNSGRHQKKVVGQPT